MRGARGRPEIAIDIDIPAANPGSCDGKGGAFAGKLIGPALGPTVTDRIPEKRARAERTGVEYEGV